MLPAPEGDSAGPIRVLRLITRLNIGGPSIQVVTLSDRLREHGFETVLVHGRLGPGEGDMSYLLPPTVTAVHEPALQRAISPLGDWRAVTRVYRLLCRLKPSIVHTHMAKAGAIGRWAAVLYNHTAGRRQPARIVHTYHGHVLEGYFSAPKTALIIGAERRLAHSTDRIIAISPQIRHELLHTYKIGREAQYAVVPLGFDLGPFARVGAADRAQARHALNIPADALVVTTVGRLTAIKQHDLLLDAAARVLQRRPQTRFLIAGDGELRSALEAQARRLAIETQVRFLGWRRDLPDLYAASDVFALTSRNEGTPVALIESMATGVAGVSTDVGGVGDVIPTPELGIRVSSTSPDAFASALESLLADPARRAAMGTMGRQSVIARYGLERLLSEIDHLYRDVLHKAAR